MGRPTRLIERHPPASVASVDTAHTPMRRLSPAPASNSPSGTSSTIEYTVWPAKRFFARLGIPAGQVHGGAVLKGVANRVEHIGLNPKWVAGFAGPDAQTGGRG